MFPSSALVWQLIEQSKLDANELPMLIARMLELKTCSRSGWWTFRASAGLDNDALLNVWLSCFVMLAATKALLEEMPATGTTADEHNTGLLLSDSNLRLFGA